MSQGHVNVPAEYPADPQLGTWCSNLRTRRKEGRVSADRIARLDELGFVWEPHEATWEEMFARLRAFGLREAHARVPYAYSADSALASWCANQRTQKRSGVLSADRVSRLDGLGFVWDLRGATWEEMFARLEAFKAREGHTTMPAKYPADPALGSWCDAQRQKRKTGNLSAQRIGRLEVLGFVWDQLDAAWEEMYARLQAFRMREGHVNVAQNDPADPSLGKWCNFQRTRRKRGRLSAERMQRLETLGFAWVLRDGEWEEMFARLEAFKAREGHANPPFDPAAVPPLGMWCNTQRQYKKKNKLSGERIQRLEALGFTWARQDSAWERMFARLEAFKARERHVNVPIGYAADSALATWCSNQRRLKRRGELSAERIRRLEALGFAWELRTAAWEEIFARLEAFRAREGHTNVPAKYSADPSLGKWCAFQRSLKRLDSLSAERIRRLEALGFVWDRIGKRP